MLKVENLVVRYGMIEAIKNGNCGVKFLNPLDVHNEDGTYKDEIKRIFKNEKEAIK